MVHCTRIVRYTHRECQWSKCFHCQKVVWKWSRNSIQHWPYIVYMICSQFLKLTWSLKNNHFNSIFQNIYKHIYSGLKLSFSKTVSVSVFFFFFFLAVHASYYFVLLQAGLMTGFWKYTFRTFNLPLRDISTWSASNTKCFWNAQWCQINSNMSVARFTEKLLTPFDMRRCLKLWSSQFCPLIMQKFASIQNI